MHKNPSIKPSVFKYELLSFHISKQYSIWNCCFTMQHTEILKIDHIKREHLFGKCNFDMFEELMNCEMMTLCSKWFLSALSCKNNFNYALHPLFPKDAKKFLSSHFSGYSAYQDKIILLQWRKAVGFLLVFLGYLL